MEAFLVFLELGGGREDVLVPFRRSVVEGQSPARLLVENNSFVLAAERTQRRDPFNGFKNYNGGWNISNRHYWASVGLTAAPFFLIAAGQGKFHGSTSTTLDFVVGQANITVANLRNFSDNLADAKKIGVGQIVLPSPVLDKIDGLTTKLNTSMNDLASHTSDNSKKIQDALDSLRLFLIIVAAAMLLLAFLGFLFSVLGMRFLVYFLVLVGWILIAGTFILCGVFLLLHNVVTDTCVAMDEWVLHPQEHTALDDILPCVDGATTNESLYQSKEVTYQVVNVVDQVIMNISNVNYPSGAGPVYYNQSGPLMPILCNPYKSDFSNRACITGEVRLEDASQVWQGYVCNVSNASGSEICTTVGRITPSMYAKMTGAVNVSYGIYHYGPFLAQLADCSFVRQTFRSISQNNCPGLGRNSKHIYVGLMMVSAAVMLSLIFWVIYARERRHRKYNKQFIVRSVHTPLQEKALLSSPRS
ncbi:putative Transmembrane protein [Cocos nucifera]|uniref:Putative Transmembrane protein n=1 Tax=Cocos nucifera TaxID=13894 RepID=A0A8K0IQ05_COCNU|nr:putative Transmembrane protein [Cocos nucifera]